MDPDDQTLVVRICAPWQSWGAETNHWEQRRTRTTPTLSGIVGLLGNAAGYDRTADAEALAALGRARMWTRVDHRGRVAADLQTVAGTINTEGARKPHSIMSDRETIGDGCFTVFLSWPHEPELARVMYRAMQDPARVLYLGRYCHLLPPYPHLHHYRQMADDDLIGRHPVCPTHPPRGREWTVVGDTALPLQRPGVESVVDRPVGQRRWQPRRVDTWQVPVADTGEAEAPDDTGYVLDGSMRLVTEAEAQAGA